MIFDASSIIPIDVSTYYNISSFSFLNENRNTVVTNTVTSINSSDWEYSDFTNLIIDSSTSYEYNAYLTSKCALSSIIQGTSAFNNQQYEVLYNTETLDFSIDEYSSIETQFVILDVGGKINILPLETHNIPDNFLVDSIKEYRRIFINNGKIQLLYDTDNIVHVVEPDVYSTITNPYGVSSVGINDLNFHEYGALAGDSPISSDLLLFDTSDYLTSNNGEYRQLPFSNGTMLCAWLSSSSISGASAVWMERWFDPNTNIQGDASLSPINNNFAFSNIVDIPSTKTLTEKEKFVYIRHGNNKNLTHINSMSSNLLLDITSWGKVFASNVNNISGSSPNYNNVSSELILDGSVYAQVPSSPILLDKNDVTISAYVYSDDWINNYDNQLFGNFSNDAGYGIMFNNGTDSNLLSFPTSGNNMFSLNYQGTKVFEKNIIEDLGLSSTNITYIKTDIVGNRWLYDSFNDSIFKLESNDLISTTIPLASSSEIIKMDIDSQNNLYAFDVNSQTIFKYDTMGTLLSSISVGSTISNFEIASDDSVTQSTSDIFQLNNDDEKVEFVGSTLYINGTRKLHFTAQSADLKIDLQNNIWVIINNVLYKISPTGTILSTKPISTTSLGEDVTMGFVKRPNNTQDVIDLWILFNDVREIIILNSDLEIIRRISLDDIFIGSKCGEYQMHLKGDFSGFDNKRKFDKVLGTTISLNNPAISFKVFTTCGGVIHLTRLAYSTKYLKGWNHIATKVSTIEGNTEISLYINGLKRDSIVLQGIHEIVYNTSSPFIIGGYSGRLGSRNTEKSIINNGYFKGRVSSIKLYDRVLSDFEIRALAMGMPGVYIPAISIPIKIPKMSGIEFIDGLHINRYRGFKSNIFDLKIKNFSDDPALQEVVKNYILSIIDDIKPANTTLHNIKFE